MILPELITAVRRKLDDVSGKTVLGEEEIVEALNFAQNEFALDTLCIFAAGIFPISADVANTAIDTDTVWITHASIGGSPLILTTHEQLDYGYATVGSAENIALLSDWRTEAGTPRFALTDMAPSALWLAPVPVADGSLYVERYKLPAPMDLDEAPDAEAEIPAAYHNGLIYGALAYLFDIPDLEIYDPNRALLYMNKWSRIVAGAQVMLQTAMRAPGRVLTLPKDHYFAQAASNTLGTVQTSNTEGGQG